MSEITTLPFDLIPEYKLTSPTGEIKGDAIFFQSIVTYLTQIDVKFDDANVLFSIFRYMNKYTNNFYDYHLKGKYNLLKFYNLNDWKWQNGDDIYSCCVFFSDRIKLMLYKYQHIFKDVLMLINQSINAERKLKIDTKKDGTNKDTKTFNNRIDGSSNTNSMNENSPINATIGDIVTPNNKNKATFSSYTEKTGTDTIDYIVDETVDDTHTETSPEYYNIVMKIYEKYNIFTILEKCFKSVIQEYNASL